MDQTIYSLNSLNFSKYGITKDGKVYSNYSREFMKTHNDKRGYPRVHLSDDSGKYHTLPIHRLVATKFIDNPEHKIQVDHINGDKTDNRVDNLRWVSNLENAHAAIRTGLMKHAVFTEEEDVHNVCQRLEDGDSIASIARDTGFSYTAIQAVKLGRNWKHVSSQYQIPTYGKDLSRPDTDTIAKMCSMIKDGKTNREIMEELPNISADTIRRTRNGKIHKKEMEQ